MASKDKSLKNVAIDIKGKSYVLVSDRVVYFNEEYPNGSIKTLLLSEPTSDIIVVKAIVTPDHDKPERTFEDYAQEVIGSSFINKTSAMENASTSAIGRALAMMGIGVLDSIASVDEITKANNRTAGTTKLATDKQLEWLYSEAEKKTPYGQDVHKWVKDLLTVEPEKLPVFKVKDAIDLIKSQPFPSAEKVPINIDGNQVDLNDIPY